MGAPFQCSPFIVNDRKQHIVSINICTCRLGNIQKWQMSLITNCHRVTLPYSHKWLLFHNMELYDETERAKLVCEAWKLHNTQEKSSRDPSCCWESWFEGLFNRLEVRCAFHAHARPKMRNACITNTGMATHFSGMWLATTFSLVNLCSSQLRAKARYAKKHAEKRGREGDTFTDEKFAAAVVNVAREEATAAGKRPFRN